MFKGRTLMAVAVVFGIWYVLAFLFKTPILPYPHTVFSTLPLSMERGLGNHFGVSGYRILLSLSWALITAVPLGLYLGRRKRIDELVSPMIYLIYPIPKIVFLPLILLLFGLGDLSKIFIIFIIVFFQILVTTRDASKGIDEEQILSVLSLGARPKQIFLHTIFPTCLPKILTSLRVSIGTSIAVLFFVESFATENGLGFFILDAWSTLDYLSMYTGIMGMGILGVVLYEGVDRIERRYCRWMFST
ncbi:MAG: ABC transporter permease subunit [Thermodesulfobacteriota bacterium]|nr:ABC transporter permease subunit [Thermodesulfobacteriota bacterium]